MKEKIIEILRDQVSIKSTKSCVQIADEILKAIDGFSENCKADDDFVKLYDQKTHGEVYDKECDHDRIYSEIEGYAYCNKCGNPMQ